jgi:hypothetical protein
MRVAAAPWDNEDDDPSSALRRKRQWNSTTVGEYSYIASNERPPELSEESPFTSFPSLTNDPRGQLEVENARKKVQESTTMPSLYTVNYASAVSEVRTIKTAQGKRPRRQLADRLEKLDHDGPPSGRAVSPATQKSRLQHVFDSNQKSRRRRPKSVSRASTAASEVSRSDRSAGQSPSNRPQSQREKAKAKEKEKAREKKDDLERATRRQLGLKEKKKELEDELISLKRIDVHLKVPADVIAEMHALSGDSTAIRDCINVTVPSNEAIEQMPSLPEGMYAAGPIIELRPCQGKLINIGEPLIVTVPHVLLSLSPEELRAYAAYLNLQIAKKTETQRLEASKLRKREALIRFGQNHAKNKKKTAMNFLVMVKRAQQMDKREKQQLKRRQSLAIALPEGGDLEEEDGTQEALLNLPMMPRDLSHVSPSRSPGARKKRLRKQSGQQDGSPKRKGSRRISSRRSSGESSPRKTSATGRTKHRRGSAMKKEQDINAAKKRGAVSSAVEGYLSDAYAATTARIGLAKKADAKQRKLRKENENLRLVDTTGDGLADKLGVAVDTTGDGIFDAVAVDTAGDGKFDSLLLGEAGGEGGEDEIWAQASAPAPSMGGHEKANKGAAVRASPGERARQCRHIYAHKDDTQKQTDELAVQQAIETLGELGFSEGLLAQGGVLKMPGGGRHSRWQHLRVLKLKGHAWQMVTLLDAHPVGGAMVMPVREWTSYRVVSAIPNVPSLPVIGAQKVRICAYISSLQQPKTGGRVEVRFWIAPDSKAAHAEVTQREMKRRAGDGYWAGFIKIGDARVLMKPFDRMEIKQGKGKQEQEEEEEERRKRSRRGSRVEVVMPKSGERHFSGGKMMMLRNDSVETGIEWTGEIQYVHRKFIIPVHTPREFRPEVNVFKWSMRDTDIANKAKEDEPLAAAGASRGSEDADELTLDLNDPVDVWSLSKTEQLEEQEEGAEEQQQEGKDEKSRGLSAGGDGEGKEGAVAEVMTISDQDAAGGAQKGSSVYTHVLAEAHAYGRRLEEDGILPMKDGFTLRIPVENGLNDKFRNAGKVHGKHINLLKAIASYANDEKPAEGEEGEEEEMDAEKEAERIAEEAELEAERVAEAQKQALLEKHKEHRMKRVKSRKNPLEGLRHQEGHEKHHKHHLHIAASATS